MKNKKRGYNKNRRPTKSPILSEEADEIDRQLEVMSAWYEDRALDKLTITDIFNHINKKYGKIHRQSVKERVHKYIKKGLIKETNKGKYTPVKIHEARNKYTPAFFIREKKYDGFFPLALSPYEFFHYYGGRKNIEKFKESIPLDFFPEINKLSKSIKTAIDGFSKKTGIKPAVITYTNYFPDIADALSYVGTKLEFEMYNLFSENRDKNPVQSDWFNEDVGKQINANVLEILREIALQYAQNEENNANKEKEIKKIKKDDNPFYISSYIISHPCYERLSTEEINKIIKIKALSIYNGLIKKEK